MLAEHLGKGVVGQALTSEPINDPEIVLVCTKTSHVSVHIRKKKETDAGKAARLIQKAAAPIRKR